MNCLSITPAWLCSHETMLWQWLLYLLPSLTLAFCIRWLTRRHPLFYLLTLAGTICHELAHLGVGLLTGARPRSFTVIPRRTEGGWELGSVVLTRLTWYNAAPSALAPFLLLTLPLLVAAWRTGPDWRFHWLDLALAFAVAPQFLSCWPSGADWRIALRSWPVAAALLVLAGAWGWLTWHGV
jgi:hypothetical protein